MDASIILNGTAPARAWLSRSLRGTVIAADGGANVCKRYGITPAYVVGDFDSVSKSALALFSRKSRIIRDRGQNTTDFEKALSLAKKIGATRIFVFGGFGSEPDHTLANILTLTPNAVLMDESMTARIVSERITISGKAGDVVSVIALTDTRGLSYTGLKWLAPKGTLRAGWIGIRNRMRTHTAHISLTRGRIAVITTAS